MDSLCAASLSGSAELELALAFICDSCWGSLSVSSGGAEGLEEELEAATADGAKGAGTAAAMALPAGC